MSTNPNLKPGKAAGSAQGAGSPPRTPIAAGQLAPDGSMHEHVHLTTEGMRTFAHVHPKPTSDRDPLAARRHRHENGEHSHPHGHAGYFTSSS